MKLEHILITGALLVVGLIVADAIGNMPLRELGMFECHYKTDRDICTFSWTRFIQWACNLGLAWIAISVVCSAHELRRQSRESTDE